MLDSDLFFISDSELEVFGNRCHQLPRLAVPAFSNRVLSESKINCSRVLTCETPRWSAFPSPTDQLPTQRSSMGPMFAHQVTMSAASRISKPCSAAWEDCNTDSTKPGTSKTLQKITQNFLHLQKIFKLAENKKQ